MFVRVTVIYQVSQATSKRGVDTKSGKVREAEALLPEWP